MFAFSRMAFFFTESPCLHFGGALILKQCDLSYSPSAVKAYAMILTCPECDSRFTVDDAMLLPDGRKVKCSDCGTVWFQSPDIDEEEDGQLDDAIPAVEDSVPQEPEDVAEPIDEESPVPQTPTRKLKQAQNDDAHIKPFLTPRKRSVAVVGLLGLLSVSYFVFNGDTIMRDHPSLRGFMGLFGHDTRVAGDGVVFERVVSEVSGTIVNVSGQLINLTQEAVMLPDLVVTFHDLQNKPLAIRKHAAPAPFIAAESAVPFAISVDIPKAVADAAAGHSVTVGFAVFGDAILDNGHGANTHPEGVENNQAHAQGDHVDPHDHAESPASDQGDSDGHHQVESHHYDHPEAAPSDHDDHH